MPEIEPEDRIIPPKAVMLKTSLSRTTLWRLSRSGDFPPAVRLTSARIGFSQKAVDRWLKARTDQSAAA